MNIKQFFLFACSAVAAASFAQAQTWQSPVIFGGGPSAQQIYPAVLASFKQHLEKKSIDANIFPQSFDVREATSQDGSYQCPSPSTEKLYIASLSWRWVTASLNSMGFYVCKTNDLASSDTVTPIPGSHRSMKNDLEKFVMVTPASGGHLYRAVGDDENFDQLPLEACLPEGYIVHGWTSASTFNANPPGVSRMEQDAVLSSKPNCVVVHVHVEGHGHDTVLGAKISKGGGSVGVELSLWGSTVDNDTIVRNARP